MSSKSVTRVLLLTSIFIVRLDCEVYQDRPKIKTSDGDLILEPALDKNIYLRPNGPKSTIFIGQIDILSINASSATQFPSNTNEHFEPYIQGSNGIAQRLQTLENNVSAISNNVLFNISYLIRRVNNINRKVLMLQTQVLNLIRDNCESQPCQHGGTCLSLTSGYHCLCPSNWEGTDCNDDVNECRNFAGTDLGCQNGATCINKPGTYECVCKNNWLGIHCTTKAKDCSGGDFEMCGHGSCIDVKSGEGIKCICHQGWTTNSTSVACLTDVNECDSYQTPRCSVNPKVDCINLPGSFRCGQCPKGYEGDGFRCTDIDECLTIPNGGCSPLVSCHNTIGSYMCGTCPSGYQGDGITCTWRGSCNIQHGGCHPSAQCVENITPTGQSAQCICPEGMDGDGIGIYGCYISHNNYTDGCSNNPCGAHGRCHSLREGYTCICFKGYGGHHCDSRIDGCTNNPCYNGGTCRPDEATNRGFRCECTAQYSGPLCQVRSRTCGGVLDHEEGSIIYPLTNTTYDHGAQCAWVIHTQLDKVINVTFTKFDLEKSPDDSECLYDFLQIHDGRKSSSQLIGRYCGNTFPRGGNIVSNTNNLYLWFHSDKSVAKNGFALHWTSVKPECGGEIDASTHGHISSPGSPGPYPANRDCYWLLSTTPGKRLSLHFFALDIEAHPNCSFDYLAIYDGEHITDPLLNKFCNSTQPPPVQSAGSDIYIHFHSDGYGHGNGFQIAYAPVEGIPGCGGYFTSDVGELVSPSYNGYYLRNLLCDYKIRTRPGTRIKLDFKQFKLERSSKCRYDHLAIYDGPSSDSQLVNKFCGSANPKVYKSTSNTLFLRFKTDNSVPAEGFKIKYEAICEEHIYGDSGIIKSPGYPFSYPSNTFCEYIIRTDPGKAIQLKFQDFDIEDSRYYNCQYDNVVIRDGPDRNSTKLGQFCGGSDRIPPVQISTHNYMYIRFQSDMSLSGTGFYANYTTINTECGGIHRETTGLINHPSGDQNVYKNNQECTWILVAPEGMHIKLTWNRFDIEKVNDCDADYLKLIEIDNNNNDTLLDKFCGDNLPPALTTTTNRLKLVFKSDMNVRSSGFSVSYTFLDERTHCGGHYIKKHGTIYSPDWPNRYGPNRDCTWIITVPVGQQIVLNISQFSLEAPIRQSCSNGDYLDVRNGATVNSPLIGQYCGRLNSKRIVSFANTLYLHFHSDFYLSGSGFKIEWDGTFTGCGGTLTNADGSVSSPNYPNSYTEDAECFYKIAINAGLRIRMFFIDLELERTPNCRDDYIQIFDGRDASSPSLGRYCMMSPGLSIETSSNYAFIKFRSDMYSNGKGFLLNYHTICNNNITGRYGVIESPNFPNNYPLMMNCLWTINVPKGNKINVTFSNFNLYKPYRLYFRRELFHGCHQDFLQTKETSDLQWSEKKCGSILPHDISTRSNSLQIKFSTGSLISYPGFRLEWVSYGCGGHITKKSGTLSLDNISTHGTDLECEWLLETQPGRSITISFSQIHMSITQNCTSDAIEIYNGFDVTAPLLLKLCQMHSPSPFVQSDSNFMLVRFTKSSTLKDVQFKANFQNSKAKCGGVLNAMSGYIYSKNYPKNYYDNMDCNWYISVPPQHRIQFNIMDIDLYSLLHVKGIGDCKDSIQLYDNSLYYYSNSNSNYTYRICQNSNITQFVSKSNNLWVQFKTDSYGTAKGFKANYSMVCGGIIDATKEGIIKNTNFVYHMNNSCIWTILAPSLDKKVSLTLTHLSLPRDNSIITNRHCTSSYLRVFDGDDTQAPLIDEYCGRKLPRVIVSHGNAITVELGSYTGQIVGTFSADYSPLSTACGGRLIAEEGSIASPNYPGPYPVGLDCEWTIETSVGNTVYIFLEQIDLEYSENCNEDYLEIRKNDGAGPILGVLCGNEILKNQTSDSRIYIKFHSNNNISGRGFLLHFGLLHDNDLLGNNGEISSPLYPNLYHGAGEYAWRIFITGRDTISLSVDLLQIPAYNEESYSKLTVYDGYDDTAPVLDELNGLWSNNKVIKSSSSVLYLKLTMDKSNTGSKFHIIWSKTSVPIDISEPSVTCGRNETILVLPDIKVTLTSPNYPNDYDDNSNCEWIYKSTIGRHLSLKFRELNIEQTPACFADSISVYSSDTLYNWKSLHENICLSNFTNVITNSSTYMKVKFITDSSIAKRGFLAEVTSICGGLITDLSGDIRLTWTDIRHSINQKTTCDWIVKVRPGRTIRLTFNHFNITNNNDACSTYIALRNGDSIESPPLKSGKYCGYDHENRRDIVTSSNSLFIRYSTYKRPDPRTFQTFTIHYEEQNEECGSTSTLTLDSPWEVINSPNYPSVPNPYTECEWVLSGPPGELLRIDFIDRFDLDYVDNCETEVVEIRDGSTSISPLIGIGRYCGEKPGTIKSSSNNIYIKYATLLSEPRNGFKANISIDVCGGTIITDSGEVKSPGYPHMQNFPVGTVCVWQIKGPPNHIFQVTPNDINLPLTEQRCGSKITIEELIPSNNSLLPTDTVLKTLCNDGYSKFEVLETSTNQFSIKLHVGKPDSWEPMSSHTGFRISFSSTRPSCGGIITTAEGYLTTPSYPQETTIRFCHWNIRVPNTLRKIRLEIIDMDLIKHSVRIYDDNFLANTISSQDNNIFESSQNKMSVILLLNYTMSSHRFKAKFSSDEAIVCGGDISDLNQELTSPDIQRGYSCDWHYNNQIPSNNYTSYNSMWINIKLNNSETQTHCSWYFSSRLLFRFVYNYRSIQRIFCGNTDSEISFGLPTSTYDIIANKKNNETFSFQISMKAEPCGGIFKVGENPVNVLILPNSYNDTIHCSWIIEVPINSKAQITMEGTFELECDQEYLKISESLNQNAPVTEYCKGKLLETPLITNLRYAFVEYHSAVKSNMKLRLMTELISKPCGGRLHTYEHTFKSPNYPKSYSPNKECAWEIQSDGGFRVSLAFIERFAIEDSPNCTKDAVIIYDWKYDSYSEIGRVCGRQTPLPFNSTNNRMKVVLRTDADINLDGFKARWTQICGGNYIASEDEKYLYSPGYPFNYYSMMSCSYNISAPYGMLLVKFLDFQLEGSFPECSNDNLTISAGDYYHTMHEVYCGNNGPPVLSNYGEIHLTFKSDVSISKHGFKIAYSIYKCGGNVNDSMVLKSAHGDYYNDNMNCSWHITAPHNKIVVLKFQYIDLESHEFCINDYVALYNGLKIDENKRFALLCGHINKTTILKSTGSNMLLQFVTDGSMNFRGFQVEIFFSYSESAGCGGHINLTSGQQILKSPLINNNVVYENFLDCQWYITAPLDTVIKISFTTFHISPCENVINQTAIGYKKCDCDMVEIRDGINPNSLVIDQFCGHSLPPQLVSSGNTMTVRLYTDGDAVSAGFEASITAQQSPCGRSVILVSHTPQRYKSPGYETGKIPDGLHCVLRLLSKDAPYSTIRISIVDIDLRDPDSEASGRSRCNKDKLLISSNPGHRNLSLGKEYIANHLTDEFFNHLNFYELDNLHFPEQFELCGHKDKVDYYVFGDTNINLITAPESSTNSHRGVEIEVSYAGLCGRNYTEPHGRIQASLATTSSDADCYTLITAPENYTISAYFIFSIPDYWDDECYLDIFDGNNTNARKLIRIQDDYDDNPVFSTGRYMLLHNRQHDSNQVMFDLNYIATDKGRGCGGKIKNMIGRVSSPLYPQTYHQVSSCEWELETPEGTNLLLHFPEFDVRNVCEQNYLQLVDRKGVVVRSYCAEETPADYTSEDNFVKLVFYTTRNNAGTGWIADFVGILN